MCTHTRQYTHNSTYAHIRTTVCSGCGTRLSGESSRLLHMLQTGLIYACCPAYCRDHLHRRIRGHPAANRHQICLPVRMQDRPRQTHIHTAHTARERMCAPRGRTPRPHILVARTSKPLARRPAEFCPWPCMFDQNSHDHAASCDESDQSYEFEEDFYDGSGSCGEREFDDSCADVSGSGPPLYGDCDVW